MITTIKFDYFNTDHKEVIINELFEMGNKAGIFQYPKELLISLIEQGLYTPDDHFKFQLIQTNINLDRQGNIIEEDCDIEIIPLF